MRKTMPLFKAIMAVPYTNCRALHALTWLEKGQPSKRRMETPHAALNGSRYSLTPDQDRSVEVTKLDQVEPSRVSTDVPQYQRLRNWGPTDLHLLPPQRLRMQDTDARVQPTDNPYHWEVPQNRNINISTWVKASWTRTNEIVRQRAGTLNRKAAVRRRRVDSGIITPSAAQNIRFHEDLEERPVIARTFSEILGSEAFVPTAILEK